MAELTWEQAVQWLREQPKQKWLVDACYFDDPLLEAAERFAQSEEWQGTVDLLPQKTGKALDLGAGRGISSYALAKAGWQVTALEPDPSLLVGGGAINSLAQQAHLPITVVEEFGEHLPFEENTFDLVHGRQVLHHAYDLPTLCKEVARVLKPGGHFIATREHVISKKEDLQAFLDSHALHKFYGGENAFLLRDYEAAITSGGLQLVKALGPFETVINYFPLSHDQWREICAGPVVHRVGRKLANLLTDESHIIGRRLLQYYARRLSQTSDAPGRLYSFVAEKA